MQVDNFDHILKTLKGRTPYRPFTVALVNGDRFEVDHPDALVVRDGVAVYIGAGGVPVLFDHEGVGQFIGDLMGQSTIEKDMFFSCAAGFPAAAGRVGSAARRLFR
jgi:hypothetical protein